jgi:spore coat polysaccharide biosynthesis protein SpsF (cytidylyltransferase family)
MFTLAVIQARMGSARLPGKVLAEVNGRPMLWYVVRRAQLAKRVDQVVVAIPDDTVEDLEIARLCAAWNVPCVSGPGDDVLARYLMVAQAWQPKPDIIVRITADCPLIDPQAIDGVLSLFAKNGDQVVYASNVLPQRTFPDGLDVEAFPVATLEQLSELATDPADREHVTSYLHRFPKQFLGNGRSIRTARLPVDLGDLRWTVDTAEDLAFVRMLYEDFGCPWDASLRQILDIGRPRILTPGGRG